MNSRSLFQLSTLKLDFHHINTSKDKHPDLTKRHILRLETNTAFDMGTPSPHKVFLVTELLEEILLNLPCPDVRRLQTVARCWRATVLGSVALQKALFLIPTLAVADVPEQQGYRQNISSCYDMNKRSRTAGKVLRTLANRPGYLFLNPILRCFETYSVMFSGSLFTATLYNETRTLLILPSTYDAGKLSACTWPKVRSRLVEPLVANMPLTSPPLRETVFWVDFERGPCYGYGWGRNVFHGTIERFTSAGDYVHMADFVAVIDRLIDTCNEKTEPGQEGATTFKFDGFRIRRIGK